MDAPPSRAPPPRPSEKSSKPKNDGKPAVVTALVLYDYTPEPGTVIDDMTPCVAITAGSSVVLTFNDPNEGWWKGDVDGTVGAFPASYVQIQEVADYGDDDVETPSLASPSELPPSAALSDDVSTLPPTGPPPTGPPPTGPPPTGPPPTRPVDSNAPPSGLPPSAPARSGGNAVAAPAAAIDAQNPAPSNLVRMQMPPPPAMPPPVASSTPPTGNGGSAIRSATGSPTKVMMKSRASKVFSEDSDDESEPYTADLNDRRTLSQMYSAQTEGVMDSSNRPELLWEGPLTKVKSGAFKSKQRFFRLTVETFSYYEENAGVLISKVATKDIASVEDSSGSKFRIILKDGVTMGRENGKSEMLLQASSRNAKAKWLEALGRQPGSSLSPGEALIVAGYLMKMQPFATTTTTRWFEVRDSSFAYYKEEGGKLFFKTHISNIQALQPTSDPTEFKLLSDVPLTKTGYYDMRLRCPSEQCRDKWVSMLQRALPQRKIEATLQLCCYMEG